MREREREIKRIKTEKKEIVTLRERERVLNVLTDTEIKNINYNYRN